MFSAIVKNADTDIELTGDIPTLLHDLQILIAAVHRVYTECGSGCADQFRQTICAAVTDRELMDTVFRAGVDPGDVHIASFLQL